MVRIKDVLLLIIGGCILGYLGSNITGYTAAFVMPKSFANYVWVWDVFVVQFIGFGLLALLVSFMVTKFTRSNMLLVVCVLFIVTQLYLSLPMGFNFYIPNLIIVLVCLGIGATCAKKYA